MSSILLPPLRKLVKNSLPNIIAFTKFEEDHMEKRPPIDVSNLIIFDEDKPYLIAFSGKEVIKNKLL